MKTLDDVKSLFKSKGLTVVGIYESNGEYLIEAKPNPKEITTAPFFLASSDGVSKFFPPDDFEKFDKFMANKVG